jgi:hypothetical protein
MLLYRSLREAPRHVVLEAAQKVYSFHHPEDTRRDALLTVERWITAGNLH